MNELPTSRDTPEAPTAAPRRRQWHAPQFFVTDFTATEVVTNGGSDGATSAPSKS